MVRRDESKSRAKQFSFVKLDPLNFLAPELRPAWRSRQCELSGRQLTKSYFFNGCLRI
jgi:hypothetical protein